ncbi:hypothetical protein L6164_026602 [Bauhinia variegata]|uniref:Uncharacterized protein n=1 Tax=Bauhinia variegata TaxID=167791 RepID=A0ACB9LRK2_BAUVA|nr:hypothetical protein L6164_026602 [Bauhinia variegata]
MTWVRLKALQDKALITICNNEVWMHDLVQEMGRQIVHEKCIDDPGRQSKLWDPDVIHHVLKSNTGSEAVEGMFFDMSKINEVCINTDVFNTMYNLRFLRFQAFNDKRCSMQLFGDLHFLPNKLRILHWEGYPLKSLPSTYCPEKLIELNLSRSRIERLWDGVVNLHNLRSINLSFCKYLVKIPDLSQALSLESIDVEDCTSLCHLPPSIFNADSLTTINARGCRGFTSFCSDTRSKSLERINLSGCTSLAVLSVTSENIKFLDLSETAIKELSPPFGCLNKLTELYLRDCKSLQHIPDRISQSEILEILDASNCFNLSKVPNQLSKLTSLYRLSLSASCIENFPTTIKDLSLLKHLELRDCKRLQHLPELPPFIQWIDARSCISLETMSNLHSTTKSIQDCFLISKEELLKRFEGGYSEEVFFYDCIKLDQSAFCGLLEGSRCRIQRAAFVSSLLDVSQVDNILIRICLPGSEVPDWFNIQALETSICCQLPAHSAVDLKILRFAFCIVVDTSPWNNESHGKALTLEVGYKFCFAGMKQQWIGYSTDVHLTQPSSREHLCMWYDDLFCRGIMDRIGNRSNV